MATKSPYISMTTFMDFVLKAGTPKATVVRACKKQEPYSPATDYYKQVRESIIEFSSARITKNQLQQVSKSAAPAKVDNYAAMITGFLKWHKHTDWKWTNPPKGVWHSNNVSVQVNPELGFRSPTGHVAVKLYFKADALTKNRSEILLELMTSVINQPGGRQYICTVLDIRNAKEWSATGSKPSLNAQLHAEAAYWQVLWNSL